MIFYLLNRIPLHTRDRTVDMVTFSSNMGQPILLVRLHNQLMRIVIDVNVFCIDHDVICISEDLCHFFQWYALCFWEDEGKDDGPDTTDDDEDLRVLLEAEFKGFYHESYQIKLPANVRKRGRSCLKVN